MDWRELWRLMLPPASGAASAPPPPAVAGDGGPVPPPDTAGDADAVRARFLFVVARTRMDLFLTIRRRFLGDRTVRVLLDRREQERRVRSGPVPFPDRRRRAERRRPADYWEDPAHHPAVLIPLVPRRADAGDSDTTPSPQITEQDKEPTMDRVLVDEARVLAWVQEGQHVLQHVLPVVLDERDGLKGQLHDATRRCQDLQEENERLREELGRATTVHRQLEQGHADIVDSVGQFLAQMTHILEPMRSLAEKLDRATTHRRDAVDRVG
jgi:hypothetical protein